MNKKTLFPFVVSLLVFLLVISGCSTDSSTATGALKLSLTDAPAANFKRVVIDFGSVAVSKSSQSNAEWLNINSDGGSIDLLQLTNGKLQELGVSELEEGKYNQIRVFVTGATIILSDDTIISSDKIHVASDTIKFVKPFTIEDGITTELVVDFDAGHSIKENISTGETPNYLYTITPVTRLASIKTTGAFQGKVTPIEDTTITVSVFKDGELTSLAGTICDESGDWMVGYLEEGIYDIKIETIDKSKTIENKEIILGNKTQIEDVTL